MTGDFPAKIILGHYDVTRTAPLWSWKIELVRDETNKQKMQQYSDTKYRAQLSTVNEGDMVLLKQVKTVIFRYLPPLRSIPSRLWKFELIADNVNTSGGSLW